MLSSRLLSVRGRPMQAPIASPTPGQCRCCARRVCADMGARQVERAGTDLPGQVEAEEDKDQGREVQGGVDETARGGRRGG